MPSDGRLHRQITLTDPPAPTLSVAGWDWVLFGATSILMLFGLLMIQSASAAWADDVYGDPLHVVARQGIGLMLGVAGTVAILIAPYRSLRRLAWPAYLGAVGLLALVMTPIGHSVNGATRWLSFGGVNVQPSEVAKLVLVWILADYLANNRGRLRDVVGVGLPGVMLMLPLLVMVIYQRDFGTTLILLGLACVLFIIAGLQWPYVASGIGSGLALLLVLVAVEPYRIRRLLGFVNPFGDPTGSGYQVVQGWIAMATGGMFGAGLANGVAQRGFLPEAHTDFVIAVVGEELGAVGFTATVALLLVVVWRAFVIAEEAPDLFGMLFSAGIGAMFAAQAIINIGVVGGCLPAKGLVLPFVSYGASASVVHTLGIGVLLKISLESKAAETGAPEG